MSDLCLLAALAASQAKQQAQQMSAALVPPPTEAAASEHGCDPEGRSAIAPQNLSADTSQDPVQWVAVERQDPEFSSSPGELDRREHPPTLPSTAPSIEQIADGRSRTSSLPAEQTVPAAAELLQYPFRPSTTPSVPESGEHGISPSPSYSQQHLQMDQTNQTSQTSASLREDRDDNAPRSSLPSMSEPSLRVPVLPGVADVAHSPAHSPTSAAVSPPVSIDARPESSHDAPVPLPISEPPNTARGDSHKPLTSSEYSVSADSGGEYSAGVLPVAAHSNFQQSSSSPNANSLTDERTAVMPQETESPDGRSPLLARIAVPHTKAVRPASGSQFFRQRWVALRAGRSYTRLNSDSFAQQWINATYQPSHEDWVQLLAQEANAMARGQGNNRLTVLLGDSISLWFPSDYMARYRFWLNQSISGDTAAGTIQRLSLFSRTRPDTIHVMLGINDLRRGVSDAQLLNDQRYIMRRLRQQHPQAQIVVHSILPTRLHYLPSDRIQPINRQLEAIAQQEGVQFLDLQPYFADSQGNLRADLTTDGLHLNPQGYATWYRVLAHFRLM